MNCSKCYAHSDEHNMDTMLVTEGSEKDIKITHVDPLTYIMSSESPNKDFYERKRSTTSIRSRSKTDSFYIAPKNIIEIELEDDIKDFQQEINIEIETLAVPSNHRTSAVSCGSFQDPTPRKAELHQMTGKITINDHEIHLEGMADDWNSNTVSNIAFAEIGDDTVKKIDIEDLFATSEVAKDLVDFAASQ